MNLLSHKSTSSRSTHSPLFTIPPPTPNMKKTNNSFTNLHLSNWQVTHPFTFVFAGKCFFNNSASSLLTQTPPTATTVWEHRDSSLQWTRDKRGSCQRKTVVHRRTLEKYLAKYFYWLMIGPVELSTNRRWQMIPWTLDCACRSRGKTEDMNVSSQGFRFMPLYLDHVICVLIVAGSQERRESAVSKKKKKSFRMCIKQHKNNQHK